MTNVLVCLQAARPSAILDIIRSAEDFRFTMSETLPSQANEAASASKGGRSKQPSATTAGDEDGAEARTSETASSSASGAKSMPGMVLPAASSVARAPPPRQCERCGYLASQPVCKACVLLEGLNR